MKKFTPKEQGLEVWHVESGTFEPGRTWAIPSGWYWRIKGRDSYRMGPFPTEAAAIEDACDRGTYTC